MGWTKYRQLGSFCMTAKPVLLLNAALTAQLLVSGCSTSPSEHPEAAVSKAAVAPPTAAPGYVGAQEILDTAASKPSLPLAGEGWEAIFDGKTLAGWRPTAFAGRGEVEVKDGLLVFNMGDPFTGVNYTNEIPNQNYE